MRSRSAPPGAIDRESIARELADAYAACCEMVRQGHEVPEDEIRKIRAVAEEHAISASEMFDAAFSDSDHIASMFTHFATSSPLSCQMGRIRVRERSPETASCHILPLTKEGRTRETSIKDPRDMPLRAIAAMEARRAS